LFNVTDAKLMGRPLQQVLDRHPDIDVVFRSHSSANGRLCFEITDHPDDPVDDEARYVRSFVDFAVRTGAAHAVPFASNHCFLHREVFHFNDTVTTPQMVVDEMEARARAAPQSGERGARAAPQSGKRGPGAAPQSGSGPGPEPHIMVSGDSWSSDEGFQIAPNDWFTNRDEHLVEYRDQVSDRLEATYAEEAAATLDLEAMARYFRRLSRALPFPLRRWFRDRSLLYVLSAGDRQDVVLVDLAHGEVHQLSDVDERHPAQVHVATHLLNQCIERDLFSHLPISKRVRYRVTARQQRTVQVLNLVFNLYEYDYLPLRRTLTRRSLVNWIDRWREVALYGRVALDVALRRGIDVERY
jgi:UDP-MurNAc hydroxylase